MQEIEGVYVANVTPIKDDAALSVDVDSTSTTSPGSRRWECGASCPSGPTARGLR